MKAVVLAGGEGIRLRPLTNETPKALLKINGIPFIERIIKQLENVGIDEAVVVIRKHAGIENYLNDKKWKIKLHFIKEDTKNIVDAFLSAKSFVLNEKEKFLLISDIIFEERMLQEFLDFGKTVKCDIVIGVSKTKVLDSKVSIDENGKVVDYGDNIKANFHAAGLWLISPVVFDFLKKEDVLKYRKFGDFLNFLLRQNQLMKGFEIANAYDIDTPEELSKAEEFLKQTKI